MYFMQLGGSTENLLILKNSIKFIVFTYFQMPSSLVKHISVKFFFYGRLYEMCRSIGSCNHGMAFHVAVCTFIH